MLNFYLKFRRNRFSNMLKIYQRKISLLHSRGDKIVCNAGDTIKDCMYDTCSIPQGIQQPCVIIIGAGIAGLSAAKRLVQCGITNFKILEATEKPGGRISTCWLGDSSVELGVDEITGASIANSIYTLAAQEGLFKPPVKRITSGSAMFFTSDGRAIDVNVAKKASSIFANLEAKAAKILDCGVKVQKQSLSAFLDQLIHEELKKLPEIERYDAARIFYGMTNGLKSKIGEDLDKVSCTIFGNLIPLPGGSIRIPLGMSGLLAPLVRELPHCAVEYCKPVNCIRWGTVGTGTPRVIVKCCDGSDYPADYVIITVSLGVLKHRADTLFCPGLPASKIDAIQKLGFGSIGKLFVCQENPFWVQGNEAIQFAWSPQELSEKGNWVKGISGFSNVPGSCKVLQATVAGNEAKLMETKTDSEIAEEIAMVLRSFMGDSSISYPKEILKSDWSTNQYHYGSFTYLGIDSTIGQIINLAEPLPGDCDDVPPIILFAGEHTSSRYFSTLHGARESGIREADRIVGMTKRLGGPPSKRICIPCKTCA